MHKRSRSILIGAAAAVLLISGCDDGATVDPVGTDIAGVLTAEGDYTSFVQALTSTGLDVTLRSGGPYTVFAPTDLAFEFLGMDTVDRLLDPQNADLLERVLLFHIVQGRLSIADLQAGIELQTLEGTALTVEHIDGELRIGGALISESDIETDSGVIQGISDVLRQNLNTADRIRITPILETFSGLALEIGATSYLASASEVTLFAPINNAFVDLGDPEFALLENPSNTDVLSRIVDFHITEGLLDIPSMAPGSTIETRDGTSITLTNEGNVRRLNGRLIVSEAIKTANGLVYLLDGVQQDSLNQEERLRISPRLSVFSDLIAERPDLVSFLSGMAGYTVFAPLNVAYEAYSPDVREAIFSVENEPLLDQLTRVHIVPGAYDSEDLQDGLSLTALDGTELEVVVDGDRIFIGGRLLTETDQPVQRGAFHRVSLLITPNVSVLDKLLLEGFTRQLEAVRRAGLDSFFRGSGPFSMFAFSNDLYDSTPGLIGRPDLDQILLYHATESVIGELEHGLVFQSIEGTNRTIAYDAVSTTYRLDAIGGLLDYGLVLNGQLLSVDALTLPPALRAGRWY